MNFFRLLFEFLVIYLLYKFIFDFIIPVYRATKQVKEKMNQMQHPPDGNIHEGFKPSQEKPEQKERAMGDYIDYEEIK